MQSILKTCSCLCRKRNRFTSEIQFCPVTLPTLDTPDFRSFRLWKVCCHFCVLNPEWDAVLRVWFLDGITGITERIYWACDLRLVAPSSTADQNHTQSAWIQENITLNTEDDMLSIDGIVNLKLGYSEVIYWFNLPGLIGLSSLIYYALWSLINFSVTLSEERDKITNSILARHHFTSSRAGWCVEYLCMGILLVI